MKRKKPTRQQVLRWKLQKEAKDWDKKYLESALNNLEQYACKETLVLNNYEEAAFVLELPNAAIAMYCLIILQKQQKIFYGFNDEGMLEIDYIPF